MRRRLVGTMLVATGVVFGVTLDRYGRMETTQAATRAEAADDEREAVAAQLKEIKTQVKDINTLLQSGKLRVVVVINAEQQ